MFKVTGQQSRQLTAKEFGANLSFLLGKKQDAAGKSISIDKFVEKLDELLQ